MGFHEATFMKNNLRGSKDMKMERKSFCVRQMGQHCFAFIYICDYKCYSRRP
jgi:hypothetical protein